ncbi:MAG: histidine kinase [Bacteroides sp. SM1_62]|nr:MAG: histidine kinase [Bacteroides sp. SM23_62]KPL20826.1 MAG: histidine kinase [Bacteroides sp. SM1_62]
MDKIKKKGRYERIYDQLSGLLNATDSAISRMATVAAVLHHKMDGFFWTGFYLLRDGKLIVGPYQGPVACQVLDKDTGVCWTGINEQKTIIVPDVKKFPEHIACDARSRSEIVIPVRDRHGQIIAVLDVDSRHLDQFDETDAAELEKIVNLI